MLRKVKYRAVFSNGQEITRYSFDDRVYTHGWMVISKGQTTEWIRNGFASSHDLAERNMRPLIAGQNITFSEIVDAKVVP